MSLFGRRIDGAHGRRAASREPTLLSESVLTLERSQRDDVVDVSSTGARLRGCVNVSIGSDLWIKVGVVDSLGTVIWSEGDLCGVSFDEPLSEEDLNHLRAESRHFLFIHLDPKERLAAQHWIHNFPR